MANALFGDLTSFHCDNIAEDTVLKVYVTKGYPVEYKLNLDGTLKSDNSDGVLDALPTDEKLYIPFDIEVNIDKCNRAGQVTMGADTPAYGTDEPTREGYTFKGWSPAVADKVTGDAVYTAVWEKIETVPETGDATPIALLIMLLTASGLVLVAASSKKAANK